MPGREQKKRCAWVTADPLYIRYHDEEWGVETHDDIRLFEALILDGAQAGLSWLTILKRREHYRQAFAGFDPQKIAVYREDEIGELLKNCHIIRNRRKIESAVRNSRAFLRIQREFKTFDQYIWSFVNGKPIINNWKNLKQIPAASQESILMSKDLKKRGFSFVGPVICYAFMQAVGMVNDHTRDCFRYEELVLSQAKEIYQ